MVIYFQPTIANALGVAIRIAAVTLAWGKCYDINNPYDEVQCPSDVLIQPGASFTFGASARDNSPSGTEGTVDLVFATDDGNLAQVYWDSPWGTQSNTLSANNVAEGYLVSFAGFNYYDGPLGPGTITVSQG